LRQRLSALHSAADDFVVNIRDVPHISHLVAASAQPALHDVKADQHPRMTQVAVVIDRHATDVEADFARLHRLKRLFGARKRVVDLKHGDQRTKMGSPGWQEPLPGLKSNSDYINRVTLPGKQRAGVPS